MGLPTEKESLQYLIEECKRPETVNIEGRIYSTKGIIAVKEPVIKCLEVHTLSGIVDYLDPEGDNNPFMSEFSSDSVFIHVENFNQVMVYGIASGKWKQREEFIKAVLPEERRFQFNSWMSIENMIIELQAKFVHPCHSDEIDNATDIGRVLSYLSRVEEGVIGVSEDDGISQTMTVSKKIGGALKEKQKAPCRVTLAPYRTFSEIDQPESSFIFRLKEGGQAALFDSDGGKWKMDAIEGIKKWLTESVPGVVIIA